MRLSTIALLLTLSVCVCAQDKVQPLNVKLGLWQTTSTFTTTGALPIPAEMLQKLTPEQRARMEERMKSSSGEKTRTTTSKSCLTKEKLDKGFDLGGKEEGCKQTVLSSTSSKADVKVVCQKEGMNSSGALHLEALSTESVKGSGQMSLTGGGHTMNTNTTFTAKWLGATCGNTE